MENPTKFNLVEARFMVKALREKQEEDQALCLALDVWLSTNAAEEPTAAVLVRMLGDRLGDVAYLNKLEDALSPKRPGQASDDSVTPPHIGEANASEPRQRA